MYSAILLATTLLSQGTAANQDAKRYDLPQIALSFDCPSNWTISTNKKAETEATSPVEGSSQRAKLLIYPANFVSESETWQLTQGTMVQQLKQKLDGQSEEVILGVPLLLTKFSFEDRQIPKTGLIGLLYSDTPRKMLFRLTAVAEDFDKAEFTWRQVLQTLRTFDGKPLKPQTPTTKTDPGKKRDPKNPPAVEELQVKPPPVHTITTKPENRPIKKAEQALELTVASSKVKLLYPNGWTAKADEAGVITLTHADVKSPIKVTLFSLLDSEPAAKTLFKVSSATLNDYKEVSNRSEQSGKNLPGADFTYIWRSGTSQTGRLYTCDAVGSLGDFYWVISYRADAAASIGPERKLLEALIDQMSLEPGS